MQNKGKIIILYVSIFRRTEVCNKEAICNKRRADMSTAITNVMQKFMRVYIHGLASESVVMITHKN
jgi:hypothetical protein